MIFYIHADLPTPLWSGTDSYTTLSFPLSVQIMTRDIPDALTWIEAQ